MLYCTITLILNIHSSILFYYSPAPPCSGGSVGGFIGIYHSILVLLISLGFII